MKRLSTLLLALACAWTMSAQDVNITFMVNAANITVSPDGLFLAGGGNFGFPGEIADNQLTDDNNDGIYEVTITRPVGFSSFYIFGNGNCPDYSCKEQLAGQACADPNNFNDRFLPPVTQDTVLMTCFGNCQSDGTCPAPPAMIDVTFRVNAANATLPDNIMRIAGPPIDGWGVQTPMTQVNDSIWEITRSQEAGSTIEWKFVDNDGTDGDTYETFGGATDVSCLNNFLNRTATFGSNDTILPTFYYQSCETSDAVVVAPTTANVTFRVNMANATVYNNLVQIAGTFDGGFGVQNNMTQVNDSVWEYTTTLDANMQYQWKFVDGDATDGDSYEMLNALDGQDCVENFGGFVNRVVTITDQDTILPTFYYESCETEATNGGGSDDMVAITFTVNTENITVSPDGIFIAGGGNFGNPGDNPLMDMGNNMWQITVMQPVGFSSYYIFTNGICPDYSCKEQLAGQSCADPNNFNDRFLPAVTQDTMLMTCFGDCQSDGTCPTAAEERSVTFRVNMANATVYNNMVQIAGTFDGGFGSPNAMTQVNDSIWSYTTMLTEGIQFEYKFVDGDDSDGDSYEDLNALDGQSCVQNFGGFVNRIVTVTQDTVLDAYYYESCEVTNFTTSLTPVQASELFELQPTKVVDQTMLLFGTATDVDRQVTVFDVSGRMVYNATIAGNEMQHTIPTTQLATGMYFVRVVEGNRFGTRKMVK